MSAHCAIPDCFVTGPHSHSTTGDSYDGNGETLTSLNEQNKNEIIAELRAENERLKTPEGKADYFHAWQAEKADHAKTLDAAEKAADMIGELRNAVIVATAEIATFRNASPQEEERTVGMKLDAKFYGQIRKVKDDSVVPDDEYIVFLAKDNAFAAILPEYLDKCISLGCDPEQITAVDRMIDRLRSWRASHPGRLKNPDAANEKLQEGK